MKDWFTAKELADRAIDGLPSTESGMKRRADRDGWDSRKKSGSKAFEYHINSLPEAARKALAQSQQSPAAKAGSEEGFKLAAAKNVVDKVNQRNAEEALKSAAALPESKRARNDARVKVLADWDVYRRISGTSINKSGEDYAILYNSGHREIISETGELVPNVSLRTLKRWRSELKQRGHLGANYGNRKNSGKIDSQQDLKDFVVAMLVDFPHVKAKQVHEAAVARFAGHGDIDLPSEGRLKVWIESWKRKNSELFCAITNPDAWKNTYLTAFGSASESATALNQIWEFDGTPADVMLVDGRHSICGVIDVYSRRPMVLVSKTARSTVVTALLRRALLDWGVCDIAKTDNGSDYTSYHTKRVYSDLEIEQVLCPPFSPWHKPHIERFFRTMSHGLVELLPGFIGHNVPERQAIEARKTFSDRLFKKDQIVEINMTSSELQTFLDDWISNIYMHRKHSGINKSPWKMVTEWKKPVRRINDARALDILLQPAAGKNGICTVHKKGLRVDKGWFVAPELAVHVGQEVRALEVIDDLGSLIVYGGEELNEFICIARCPERSDIDRAEFAAKAREIQKRTIQEAKRELKAAAKKVDTSTVVREIMQAGAEQSAKLVSFPRESVEHATPALQASAEAATAIDGYIEQTSKSDRVEFLRKALEKAEQEEAAAQNNQRQKRLDEMDNDELYQHWKQLDATVKEGRTLDEVNAKFHANFPRTPEFETQQMMEEDFAEFYGAK